MNHKIDYVAAIDIGTTKIVAIVGKKNEKGKLEILGVGKCPSNGVKRGVVQNIEETATSIQEAVRIAEEKSGIKITSAYVGIAGQHIKSTRSRGYRFIENKDGEITQDDVKELTKEMYLTPIEAGEEIIHVIAQNYIVDNETGIKNPVGISGKKLEGNFHIVIGQTSSAKNIEKCVNRVGIKVAKMILEPLASADAVLTEDEKEVGVAMIDIGGGTTDLAVYYDGIIRHTAVIPFGGNVITKDIKEGCRILQRQAEAVKMQHGMALGNLAPESKVVTLPGISGRDAIEISFKTLANIIEARMEEIIEYITYEIENSGFMNRLGAGIVVTGGGALLQHLPQLFKFQTGLDVRIGYPGIHFSAEVAEELNQPNFATGIGLLIKGFNDTDIIHEPKNEIKTETPEEQKTETEQKKRKGFFTDFKDNIAKIFDDNDKRM